MGRILFSNSFGTWTLKARPWGIQLTAVANSGRERMECTCVMSKCEGLFSSVCESSEAYTHIMCGTHLLGEGHVINPCLGFPSWRRRYFTKVAIGVVHDPSRYCETHIARVRAREGETRNPARRLEWNHAPHWSMTPSPFLTFSLFHKVFQTTY